MAKPPARAPDSRKRWGAPDMLDDEQLERRMRDWHLAERAAREAEKAAHVTPHDACDAVESPSQRASRLRHAADAMLAAIMDDVRTETAA